MRDFALAVEISTDGPLAVVGPSGAGKSTILRLVAGLLTPTHGQIECRGRTWFGPGVDLPVERRPLGFVFQDYALFPHMTVRGNVAFGARRPVEPVLDRMRIAQLADQRPGRLSGGERQRVAVGRAVARDPDLLLLDEPLSALDPSTRDAVGAELASVLRETGVPALVVTHSFEEAATLASRIAVLELGTITQTGSAEDLLADPATPFVARFAGLNHLLGVAQGSEVVLESGARVRLAEPASGAVAVLVAPWEITLALAQPHSESALNHIAGSVERVVRIGNRARVTVAGLTAEVTQESASRLGLRPGLDVVATWKATSTRTVAR